MAVKNHNTYNIGNISNGNDLTMITGMDPNNNMSYDQQMIGGSHKYVNDQFSDSNVGTNYTKNRNSGFNNAHLAESQDVSENNKRNKRTRKLPKINDSPKGLQYSSDFTKGRVRRG